MEEKETSTVKWLDCLISDLASRNDVEIRLAKKFGPRWEHVTGTRNARGLATWRFSIDPDFSLFIEAAQFPEHLVDELTVLGEEIVKRIYEKGT